jgi:hypothetical protein
MKLTNAIKKATSILKVTPVIENGRSYKYIFNGHELSFFQNGRADEATCFYTRPLGQEDDITTDYFAGTFHDNLTQAINFIRPK